MKNKEIHSQLHKHLSKILDSPDIDTRVFENSSGVQFTLEEFFDHYNPEEIQIKNSCNILFKIKRKDIVVAAMSLKDMQNCSGILVASDLIVSPQYRNMRIGSLLTEFMSDFARYYGYGIIQGTDRDDNIYQKRIFEKQKWEKVTTFNNPKTGNVLNIWLLNLS